MTKCQKYFSLILSVLFLFPFAAGCDGNPTLTGNAGSESSGVSNALDSDDSGNPDSVDAGSESSGSGQSGSGSSESLYSSGGSSTGGSSSNGPSSGSVSIPMPTPTSVPLTSGVSNFFGIHTLIGYADDMEQQMDWAHKLVGDGGYIKQFFYGISKTTKGPSSDWVEMVKAIYARNMIPVIRIAGSMSNGYWQKPEMTAPGDYSELAAAIKSVFEKIPLKAGVPLYVEVYNETNLKAEWSNEQPDPTAYGHLLVQVADALHSIGDPRIIVLNGALSPGGNYNNIQYVRDMIKNVPESLYAFDAWASHPYPADHPPEYNNHDKTARYGDFTIDSYMLELAVLEKSGRRNTKVLITETGYELGNNNYGFEGMKAITETLRTDYITRAFRDYWSQWPEIIAVCPFEMYSSDGGWTKFDWIRPGSSTDDAGYPTLSYPQFRAVADLAKRAYIKDPALQGTVDKNMVIEPKQGNLANGAAVTVSSSIENWGWSQSKINNGITNSTDLGWTSSGNSSTEWVQYKLTGLKNVKKVLLYPRSDGTEKGKYFPQAFEIQASSDGIVWTSLYKADYTTNFNPGAAPQEYTFNAVTTRYIRLYMTRLTNNGSGAYHAQLSEFEVY